MITIYHNARCSKSRGWVAHAENVSADVKIINYIDNPPTPEELSQIIKKLKINPVDLIRKNERLWTEKFASQSMTDQELIVTMSANPILIQRPIVIDGDKAFIARDNATLQQIFGPLI